VNRTMGVHVGVNYDGPVGAPLLVVGLDLSAEDWERIVNEYRADDDPGLFVVRWYEGEQPLDNPVQNARDWFDKREAQMHKLNAVCYPCAFQAYNEIADDQAEAYCAFEAERLYLMHNAGLRSCVGNFSVGTPHESKWALYELMLDEMCNCPTSYDVLGLHEYASSLADVANPWHVGRFALPEVAPYVRDCHIAIAETGLDWVEQRGGAWRNQGLSSAEYLGVLEAIDRRYDDLRRQGWKIEGAAVYQAGVPNWRAYDVSEMLPFPYAEPEPWPEGEWVQVPDAITEWTDGDVRYRTRTERWTE
jgi:hypothetical protein